MHIVGAMTKRNIKAKPKHMFWHIQITIAVSAGSLPISFHKGLRKTATGIIAHNIINNIFFTNFIDNFL